MDTLGFFLKKGEDFLREKGIEKPRLEAQLIFSHLLQLERYKLITEDKKPLTPTEINDLRQMLVERAKGTPSAYLLGKKNFCGRDFFVSEATLIPRPETEELISWVLENDHAQGKIADIGTGTGCIGITLSLESKNETELTLIDISGETLLVAEKNREQLISDKNCNIFQSNLFKALPASETFSLIVSNPPYIPQDEYEKIDDSVRNFEPVEALLVENPDHFFKELFSSVFSRLDSGGWFYLETNPSLIDRHFQMMQEAGFKNVETRKDYSQRNHFLRGSL